MSADREHEKAQIFDFHTKNIITKSDLCNFNDIVDWSNPSQLSIAIIGDFTYGTGNLITAVRLRKIMKDIGYKCFNYNLNIFHHLSENTEAYNDEINKLELFLINNRISFIMGIHLWRAGRIITSINNKNSIYFPYILVCAGTDANVFVKVNI